MPFYVRQGQGSYMVNVKGKQLDYALDILNSEGHKGVVSDTLFSSAFKPGIVIDQYPSTKMKVKDVIKKFKFKTLIKNKNEIGTDRVVNVIYANKLFNSSQISEHFTPGLINSNPRL